MSDFPTEQLLETAERVAKRWKDAVAAIDKAEYGPNQLLRDALGFWTHDVGDVWLGTGSGTRTILISVQKPKSDKIPIKEATNVRLTPLGQLGGTNVIRLHLDTTSFTGAVVVGIPPGGAPIFVQPPSGGQLKKDEQYVGLLYEGQKPIATVIYLHL
jgi:hypothetical protein